VTEIASDHYYYNVLTVMQSNLCMTSNLWGLGELALTSIFSLFGNSKQNFLWKFWLLFVFVCEKSLEMWLVSQTSRQLSHFIPYHITSTHNLQLCFLMVIPGVFESFTFHDVWQMLTLLKEETLVIGTGIFKTLRCMQKE